MPGASLESITGRLGVGSITLLGLFMFFDGHNRGVYSLVEMYGKSVAWGILGVVPTIVVTYILGVFCTELADLVLGRVLFVRSPNDAEVVLAISSHQSGLLEAIYAEQIRDFRLLKGASVSFLFLAVGCLGEAPHMREFPMLVILSALGSVGFSVLSILFAYRTSLRVQDLVRAARASGAVGA